MSRDYKQQILTRLLDWYEVSPAYIRGETPNHRRMMRLYDGGNGDFPAYNIEDHIARKDINQAVLELAQFGLVGYDWMQGEREHFIAKVWLNFDNLTEAYLYTDRQPKNLQVDAVVSQLLELSALFTEKWASDWAHEQIATTTRKRSVGSALPSDESERADLFRAILALNGRTEVETLERVFSMHLFGDSKRFERVVRSRLIRILEKFLVQEEDATEESVLRLVGLTRVPEQFEFSGKLALALSCGVINFSLFPHGATITSEDVSVGDFICGNNINRVLSIENKANYIDYVRKNQTEDELVIYHGGQYSPAKRIFLQKLCAALPKDCAFCHWGDIDFGGFSMLGRLRREIFPGVRQWRMGVGELEQYRKYCTDFKKPYADRLRALLSVPELDDCTYCIQYMLKNVVRLEQEAMLT